MIHAAVAASLWDALEWKWKLLRSHRASRICLAFDIETAVHSKAAEHCRTPRPAGYYALVSRLAFWSAAVLRRFPVRQITPDTKRFTFVRMTTPGAPPGLSR